MIRLGLEGFDAVRLALLEHGKQARFATAVALTRTAKDVESAVYAEFRKAFDRPTPTTMKSLRVKTATRQDLTAEVFVKDRALGAKNPNSMAEVLGHQFTGGHRIRKQSEWVMQQAGFISADEYLMPGKAAKLDAYGNISRGQLTQIISQLGIKRPGYDSASAASRRSRRNVARAGVMFWSHGPKAAGGKPLVDPDTGIQYGHTGRTGRASPLAKGVWMREGRRVKPILMVIRRPTYRRRIDMDAIGRRVMGERFDDHFATEFKKAMATAR